MMQSEKCRREGSRIFDFVPFASQARRISLFPLRDLQKARRVAALHASRASRKDPATSECRLSPRFSLSARRLGVSDFQYFVPIKKLLEAPSAGWDVLQAPPTDGDLYSQRQHRLINFHVALDRHVHFINKSPALSHRMCQRNG